MQGFTTSAPKQGRGDATTIESFILPNLHMEAAANPLEQLRVPLLPDTYNPNRSSFHAAEALDAAAPRSEISIVAAHPEHVAAAMSEVVGNDGLDVDIGQLTSGFADHLPVQIREPGALKELLTGIVDDILGAAKQNPKLA